MNVNVRKIHEKLKLYYYYETLLYLINMFNSKDKTINIKPLETYSDLKQNNNELNTKSFTCAKSKQTYKDKCYFLLDSAFWVFSSTLLSILLLSLYISFAMLIMFIVIGFPLGDKWIHSAANPLSGLVGIKSGEENPFILIMWILSLSLIACCSICTFCK